MQPTEERILNRDCKATAIPYGEAVTIPEGTTVYITHRLGGNFTVQWAMGLARISGEDGDALGEDVSSSTSETATRAEGQSQVRPDAEAVWERLKSVYDPEIPVNVVDLGLIYSMEITEDEESGTHAVRVQMTLTAPGCGMGPAIAEDARAKVTQVPGVESAEVELVWDPPWHQEMISEEGKMQLGLI